MKFIELTDRFNKKIAVNFDRVESFNESIDNTEKFTRLDFASENGCYIYVKETYEQVKEALGG